MLRQMIFGLLALCPAAVAQETEAEGRRLADALTQADVHMLGACQARVEACFDAIERARWRVELNNLDEDE